MVEILNLAAFIFDCLVVTACSCIFLLHLFKKKSILKRINSSADESKFTALVLAIFFSVAMVGHNVVNPEVMYGFSLGSFITGMSIGVILCAIVLTEIEEWFAKLPET